MRNEKISMLLGSIDLVFYHNNYIKTAAKNTYLAIKRFISIHVIITTFITVILLNLCDI